VDPAYAPMTPGEGQRGGDPPDWSQRPRGGWDEFVRARGRLRQNLASGAEIARLERLFRESPGIPPPPQPEPRG